MRLGTPSGLRTTSTGEPSEQVRHVLLGEDAADDALVPVAAGHLVADLQLALDGQVDLDHLDDAGGKLVALLKALDLLLEVGLDLLAGRLDVERDALHGRCDLRAALDLDVPPVLLRHLLELLGAQPQALAQQYLAIVGDQLRRRRLAVEQARDATVGRPAHDLQLVSHVLAELGLLGVLDGLRARVLVDALTGEDPRVDDRALDARRHAQRGVAHVTSLLTEDRAQELLFRSRAASHPSA